MKHDLTQTQLFQNIDEKDLPSLLHCLGAVECTYKKGELILPEGQPTERIGVVLSGLVLMECSDVWGNNSVLGSAAPGSVFAEAYACIPGEPLSVSVSAAEDSTVLFLNISRVLTMCSTSCVFHSTLVRNLLTVCAQKNLQLSRRIFHTSAKSIRGRLQSYFSECAKRAGSRCFCIPYNRQQLADYLGVDRSAMSNELSKMQREGLIEYEKNRFSLIGSAHWEDSIHS